MRKFFKNPWLFLLGIFSYMILAVSSSTGGGGGGGNPPAACNETTVSLTIRVNWGAITTYPSRSTSCLHPTLMTCLPSTSTCNGPSSNTVTKGIVEVTIALADPNQCTLSKNYFSRQYYVTAHNDDVVSEVPKKTIKITLKYFEACGPCTTAISGNSRAVYTSETIVPEAQINSGALIQLHTPQFFNAVTTSNCF